MALDLLSGIAQGFVQGQQKKLATEQAEEEKKLKIKMFKRQIEMEDQQKAAQSQLLDLLSSHGQTLSMPEQVGMGGGAGPTNPQNPSRSIAEVLKTPEGQRAALGAGYKLNDIRQFQTPDITELLASGQLTGAMGKGGGFQLNGIKMGPDGKPTLDLGRNEIWKETPSPDGKFMVQIDRQGNELGRRPIGPNERPEEDKPILNQSDNYINEKGETPPPTMTFRQIAEGGYKPKGDKVSPEQAGRIAGLVQAKGQVQSLRNALVKDGKVDRSLLFSMNGAGPIEGVPLTEGRTLRQDIGNAISSIVYVRTGAAMPPSELKQTLDQLLPSPLDNNNGVKSKLDRLDQFLDGSLDVVTLPPSVRKAYEAKKKGGNKEDPLGLR